LERDEREKTRQERQDIPKMAPMGKDTEYLEVFDVLMKNLEKTEELWSSYLQPVMNNVCMQNGINIHASAQEGRLPGTEDGAPGYMLDKAHQGRRTFERQKGHKWSGNSPNWVSTLP
jgi:hypothetical protein